MNKNLNVSTFRNGDTIPQVQGGYDWQRAAEKGQPAWCYYENNSANGETLGKLYNWWAVSDERGLAPAGWHIPSFEEWGKLNAFFGDDTKAANELIKKNGFNSMPGGIRKHYNGEFESYWPVYWSNEEFNNRAAYCFNVGSWTSISRFGQGYGMYVRCVKD